MTKIKIQRKESRYVSVLTVQVNDAYSVIEGMRYDRCCPSTELDSRKICRLFGGLQTAEDRIVTLTRYASAPTAANAQRWRSFGCVVIDERDPQAAPITLEEAKARLLARLP